MDLHHIDELLLNLYKTPNVNMKKYERFVSEYWSIVKKVEELHDKIQKEFEEE